MDSRLIETADDIAEGCAWLAGRCDRMAEAHALCGLPPLRRRPGGYPALLQAIVSQQLSVASADAVWGRLAALGAEDPAVLLAAGDEALRKAGLSRQKIAYAQALAAADLDYAALAGMPEDEALAALTAVKGIGQWTAEIYLMFAVGRRDVFAAGDLALQEAARILYGLEARPTPKALRRQAEAWAPWRAVAARMLWAYYRHARNREGVTG
ncbi:DNA-3-methyladenine glycosylase [Paralimibaculum aggregatum]|uniref:DNA-3-methyladenine glycosylase II n=1 Tax=Paralimibaculum aggregatum TaxID=3036245 RepID=A0ABQ6LBS6_9RHOB|nr:DNA-3-methyladenine glycosylase 2 family protein [Limibaculum sp. NKW23]GMG80854.1 DNA-3-methyladenine glycosylase [Limibaculum sp. NKW23]